MNDAYTRWNIDEALCNLPLNWHAPKCGCVPEHTFDFYSLVGIVHINNLRNYFLYIPISFKLKPYGWGGGLAFTFVICNERIS